MRPGIIARQRCPGSQGAKKERYKRGKSEGRAPLLASSRIISARVRAVPLSAGCWMARNALFRSSREWPSRRSSKQVESPIPTQWATLGSRCESKARQPASQHVRTAVVTSGARRGGEETSSELVWEECRYKSTVPIQASHANPGSHQFTCHIYYLHPVSFLLTLMNQRSCVYCIQFSSKTLRTVDTAEGSVIIHDPSSEDISAHRDARALQARETPQQPSIGTPVELPLPISIHQPAFRRRERTTHDNTFLSPKGVPTYAAKVRTT